MRSHRWLFREGALVVGLAALALALLPGARGREARLAFGEELPSLPTVELEIDEDRLAALEAGRPRGVRCARPRGADVAVRSVRVNGRVLAGSFRARYRGLCREHWGGAWPSLTIESEDRGRILGRRSLDLNSIESDAELYDAWVGRMAFLIHAPATRTAFLHLSINGRDAGTRVVVENLDDELLDTQGLRRGAIFRERISTVTSITSRS
ncbi:hypothetical protein JYT86_00460 [bacterium AH-315-N03]|nr:hypothetical protein [bacterium AH-315-N03]